MKKIVVILVFALSSTFCFAASSQEIDCSENALWELALRYVCEDKEALKGTSEWQQCGKKLESLYESIDCEQEQQEQQHPACVYYYYEGNRLFCR